MDYMQLAFKLAQSALSSVGILAIILPIFGDDPFFLLFFLLLIVSNFVLVLAVKNFAPKFFSMTEYAHMEAGQNRGIFRGKQSGPVGNIGFTLSPIAYPQVHDEELRTFAPEFIRMDISGDNGPIFAGNLSRDVLKQFRQTIDTALEMKSPQAPVTIQAVPAVPQKQAAPAKKKKK